MFQTWRKGTGTAGLWACQFVDDDGLSCVEQAGHSGDHRDSGLRQWIETTQATAVVRVYEGTGASDAYSRESTAFARHGWRVIALDDTTSFLEAGPSRGQVGLLGPIAAVIDNPLAIRRIAVCFARPPLIAAGS